MAALFSSLLLVGLTAVASAEGPLEVFLDPEFVASAQEPANTTVRKYFKGYKRMPWPEELGEVQVLNITQEMIDAAPDAIDWSQKGATSPIKDQGQCGSCWAFSTTEGVESAVFMSSGTLPPPLSTQELVACDKIDGGCQGGDIPTGVRYLKRVGGMDSAADYPDTSHKTGRNGWCRWDKKTVVQVTGMSYAIPQCQHGNCANQNEEALAAALATHGPISICINSGDRQPGDWMKYKGGVLEKSCKGRANLIDHCVQLVGYDKSAEQPYWKIKNSWGESWGENGFIRIPYGKENACCVGCEAVVIQANAKQVE